MQQSLRQKPKVILFDVYDTILDMGVVERKVNALLESKRGYLLWNSLFMQYCFVDNCTVQFHTFSSIAEATLRMTAKMLKVSIDTHDCQDILDLMKQLPIKEQVAEGLSALHDRGFRIAALTNTPEKIVQSRMEVTGLVSYFERVFSAERVRKYKPSIEVYRWVCQELDVAPEEVLMLTTHGWDIAGADNAGMQTAYLMQPNSMLYALSSEPDYSCKDLQDLARQL